MFANCNEAISNQFIVPGHIQVLVLIALIPLAFTARTIRDDYKKRV